MKNPDLLRTPDEDDFCPTLFLRAALISLVLWGIVIGGIYWSFHS